MTAARRSLMAILLGALSSGCAYRLGGWNAPESVRTVAVPTFDNATFPLRRDVEYDLTRAVRRQFLARTDLRLVDQSSADIVVYGKVTEFRERVVAEGVQDEKLESNIRITVELTVEDGVNRTRWQSRVRDTEPFSIARGETIDVARGRAIDNLAEKILLAVEPW